MSLPSCRSILFPVSIREPCLLLQRTNLRSVLAWRPIFFKEEMAQRAASIEILRLRNQRSAEEIAFLKDSANFTYARSSTSSDNTTVRDQPPPPVSGVALAHDRSSTIIKECEKELVKNLLQVSAPGPFFCGFKNSPST